MHELVSIKYASRYLGTTITALLHHLSSDKLQGQKVDGQWFITRRSLLSFAEHRGCSF